MSHPVEGKVTKITRVFANEYRDSLFLMKLSNDVSTWKNVHQAVIVMGTESNKRILSQVGLLDSASQEASSHDLIVAVEGKEGFSEVDFLEALERRMTETEEASRKTDRYATLDAALAQRSESALVFIAVPGQYAAPLVQRSLEKGKHVFCFSQHMPIEDEIALKEMAIERGLLLMGPDCGTAQLDGIGLGFANQVRTGAIGIVSAAGSGLQEVMSLIERAGGGVSQAIGVGGRDMTEAVGGLMAEAAVRLIGRQAETKVIVVLAKKASLLAQERVLAAAAEAGLPVVVNFARLADGSYLPDGKQIVQTDTFEECAREALSRCGLEMEVGTSDESRESWLKQRLANLHLPRRVIRGLFGGGSLCAEARTILESRGFEVETNLEGRLDEIGAGHVLLDLGAEEYTQGAAHPFIDPRSRLIEIEKAWSDPQVAVLLLDLVLGWGCHPDPAAEVARTINRMRANLSEGPAVVASVCGTCSDPQDFIRQVEALRACGVFVSPSNASASRLAAELAEFVEGER
jgi:FdrA protein